MHRSSITLLALVASCLAAGAWIAAGVRWPDALAQDPEPAPPVVTPAPVAEGPDALICRLFDTDVASGSTLDTSDRTTEVGQWVGERQDEGWHLFGVDFEVGQKSTGYPQGYLQVCVSKR